MAKHTFEEKLDIVSQVKNGKPILRISRERHIGERMILEWVLKYDLYSENGLLKQPNIRSPPDFKEEVVRIVLEKEVPLMQVVLQYGVSRAALERWVKLVRVEGYGTLHQHKNRGRPPKDMSSSKKHEPETELEKLHGECSFANRDRTIKKSLGLSQGKRSPRTHEWAKAIEELRPKYDVAILLDCKQMARSVFYYHLKRLNSRDKYKNEKEEIIRIYHLHKGRYGYRRVTE